MNIVCIDECYNHQMEKYVINGIYCYYESDTVSGLELKYYNIYTREGKRIGTGNKSFINKNFITLFEYNKAMHDIDCMYEMWFNV